MAPGTLFNHAGSRFIMASLRSARVIVQRGSVLSCKIYVGRRNIRGEPAPSCRFGIYDPPKDKRQWKIIRDGFFSGIIRSHFVVRHNWRRQSPREVAWFENRFQVVIKVEYLVNVLFFFHDVSAVAGQPAISQMLTHKLITRSPDFFAVLQSPSFGSLCGTGTELLKLAENAAVNGYSP